MAVEAVVTEEAVVREQTTEANTSLKAIMFTDIVDYSRLMQENAERTLRLREVQEDLLKPCFQSHKGEVQNNTGDGFLITFSTTADAIDCAVAIQRKILEENAKVAAKERFQLRIGLHSGDVTHEKTNAYGDAVNIAARVLPYAVPGGICMSEGFKGNIKSHVENQRIHSLGRKRLKNIERPMELFHLWPGREHESPLASRRRFLAGAGAVILGLLGIGSVHTRQIFLEQQRRRKNAEDRYTDIMSNWRNSRQPDIVDNAIASLLRLRIDYPEYEKAPGALAYAQIVKADQSRDHPEPLLRLAKEDARTALNLDKSEPLALAALAQTSLLLDWKWDFAEQTFQEALTHHANNETVLRLYANLLIAKNRSDLAKPLVARVVQKQSNILMCRIEEGILAYFSEDIATAVDKFGKAVSKFPEEDRPKLWLGRARTHQGQYSEAEKVLRSARMETETKYARAYNYARAGKIRETQNLLKELDSEKTKDYASPALIAKVHAGLYQWYQKTQDQQKSLEHGKKALDLLKEAKVICDPDLEFLKVDPAWKFIRDGRNQELKAGFQEVLHDIGLNPAP